MRSRPKLPILLLWLAVSSCVVATAQSTPTTGVPPLSSTADGPFDVVNLANLNSHFAIPVFSRPGKGISFSYSLIYDSLVWQVTTNSLGQLQWTPMPNWGWHGSSEPTTGYVTYSYSDANVTCGPNTVEKETWTNFVYHDPFGVPHGFGGSVYLYDDPGCGSSHPSMTVRTVDGSGYQIQVGPVTTAEQNVPTTVTGVGGIKFSPPSLSPSGSGTVHDTNGNLVNVSSSGVTTITDTLGSTALTISGAAPTVTYTYEPPTITPVAVTVHYASYTVQTNFNISLNGSHIQEYGPQQVYLVSSITLADGSSYSLTYEKTNGSGNNITGRIASVTLPTQGAVAYSYANSGCSNIFNCMMADGSPSHMTRNVSYSGTFTYTRSVQSGQQLPQASTTVLDPAGNETDLNFSGIYETARYAYSGNGSSKTLLRQTAYCYQDTNWSSCLGAVVTAPVTWRKLYDWMDLSGGWTTRIWSYNSTGLVTEEDDQDYSGGQPTIRKVKTSYNTTLCSSYNICDRPSSIQVTDGSNVQAAYTTYNYDEGGNTLGSATTVSKWVSGSKYLTSHFSYNNDGTVASSTGPNGAVTTYTYAPGLPSCSGAFPTKVTSPPTPWISGGLVTSYQYNCTGGVLRYVTDPNCAVASTGYTDPYFWRPTSSTDALGNVTTYTYPTPNQTEAVMNWTDGVNYWTNDVITFVDGFGRTYLTQKRQAPGSTQFDTVQTDYDYPSYGKVHVSLAVQALAGSGDPTRLGTTTTYDPLGRVSNVIDAAGGATSYSYWANDVFVTVTGSQMLKWYQEYDALGRLTSVCEVSGTSADGTCGQVHSGTGIWTTYQYDPNGNLTYVKQNAQTAVYETRQFSYDGVGRMTSEWNPETGASSGGMTQYVYDSDSACPQGLNATGNLVRRIDPAGRTNCYTWDLLNRQTATTYTDSGNSANSRNYYYVYDTATPQGVTVTNPAGRLVEGYAATPSQILAMDVYGYSARGEMTDSYQWSLNDQIWRHVYKSYKANGAPYKLQGDVNGTLFTHQLSYNWDGEGRPVGIWDATTQVADWWWTYYNAASQPTSVLLANGGETFQYDSNTGRMKQWTSTFAGNGNQTGTLSWNTNGTLAQMKIVSDTYNPGNVQTCNYGYDGIGRITSGNCGSVAQTFAADSFGNLFKLGSFNFQPSYTTANHIQSFTYDGVGDVTNDGSYSYGYDFQGRPISENGYSLVYDAFGRVVEVNHNNGTATRFLYQPDGSRYASFSIASGHANLVNYFMPMVNGMVEVFGPSGELYNRHADWLGSSRLATDPGGNPVYDRAYAPYGETYAETGTSDRSFTGQTQDVVQGPTGIYDFLFRQQSAAQGRWLVPDPAGLAAVDITNPQTWNRYAYVGNNPLSNVDPLGLEDYDYLYCSGGQCTDYTNVDVTPGGGSLFIGGAAQNPRRFQLLPLDGPGEGRGFIGRRRQQQPQAQPPIPSDDQSRADVARCAAANASSLASLLGISQSNWLGQSLLGNDVSTIVNITLGPNRVSSAGQAAISNPTPFNAIYQVAARVGSLDSGGIRLVGTAAQDAWGFQQFYAKAITVAETGGAKALSKSFAVFSATKLAYDLGAYGAAYAQCSGWSIP